MPLQNVFDIDLDIKQKTAIRTPTVTQNDAVVFNFRIFDEGRPYDVEDGSTFTMTSTRPDKQTVITVAEVTGPNTISCKLGSTEIAVSGKVSSVIQLYDAAGRVSTIPFSFSVSNDPSTDYIPSEDEKTLIQQVLGDGPEILADAQKATTDANTAATNANSKAQSAATATTNANNAANAANIAKTAADTAAANANTQAETARVSGEFAESMGNLALDSSQDADNATHRANAAAENANEKATLANEKAALATTAANNAIQEASNLNSLKTAVTQATTDANTAATNANQKATEANTQASHAKTQGDYAKREADRVAGMEVTQFKEQLDDVTAQLAQIENDLGDINSLIGSTANGLLGQ